MELQLDFARITWWVITQKTTKWILTAVKTSNLIS
jgi:hypothetical protein